MPLWGRNKDDEPSSNNGDSVSRTDQPTPVDEHARLLPNRLSSDYQQPHLGYLSPDDPAVSPYNLWRVRFARAFTVVLTTLSCAWWALLLVSIFITPPGMHVRGSIWFAFSYASLAISMLLITLAFFTAPAQATRVLSFVVATLLLVDLIIIVAVPQMRYEELWIGVASVVWALMVALWTLLADRTVAWAKTEEEERLTGRPETRRTIFEWTEVLLSSLGLTVVTVVALLMTLTLVIRALDARHSPPGEKFWVDEDRYRIHVYCQGSKTDAEGRRFPTVFLEGGEDAVEVGLWRFAENALNNGSIARYCFADRPGIGWSDVAPSPFSASVASTALSEALVRAGEEGPWVLVSAGIGSIYSRIFSSRHGEDIKAILMIDPLHEDLLHDLGSTGRGFLLWLRGVISPLGIDHIPGSLIQGKSSADRGWGRYANQNGKTVFAKLQESQVASTLTRREVVASRAIQLKSTPLAVVSSGVQIRKYSQWQEQQRDMTTLTDNLEDWDIIDNAPHRVWDTLEGRELIERRLKKLVQV